MKANIFLSVISALLIVLFVYTAVSKLISFEPFKGEMYNQILPHAVATLLIWTLPATELLTALLLCFERTRIWGMFVSALLMLLFTGYVMLVLLGVFGRVPCTCGGVIRSMSWEQHLVFNLFFLVLAVLGIKYSLSKRGKAENP